MIKRRYFLLSILILLGFVTSLSLSSVSATPTSDRQSNISAIKAGIEEIDREAQGRKLYETGQFERAAEVWQQAAEDYRIRGEIVSQARVLSNLSLAYQKLGQWQKAQSAIDSSFSLLKAEDSESQVLAQALNTQGTLQLSLGQTEKALESWQEAEKAYNTAGDRLGAIQTQINQVQALQALGFYRRALAELTEASQSLETVCDRESCDFDGERANYLKVVVLERLGSTLIKTGDIALSKQKLEKSLTLARQLNSNSAIAAALFSLGNNAKAAGEPEIALDYYQQALKLSFAYEERVENQLAQLKLRLEEKHWQEAGELIPKIQALLAQLPLTHAKIYARLNFARSLVDLQQNREQLVNIPSEKDLAQLLATAMREAKELGDNRAISYAVGNLGNLYERSKQWSIAQQLTEEALVLAHQINAPDITYLWHWQLGRILAMQGNKAKAIDYYRDSVNTLKLLRKDLATINPEIQFSFRDSVEPVHRELVALLLEPDSKGEIAQENLQLARNLIESLQLAELDNFFQEACLQAKPVKIDDIDPNAAVIYPIILADRLEVILRLPQQPLKEYRIDISQEELESTVDLLSQTLVIRSKRDFFAPAGRLYDWLIRPLEADLVSSGVKTLVFVPDGSLRKLPLETLYDGKKYLIEKYATSITPSLQLLSPQAIGQVRLKALVAGLTEEREGFSPLDYVSEELKAIENNIPSVALVDRDFTSQKLEEKIEFANFPIVHIATHGQFSSSLANTFILTWDGRLSISDLDSLLETTNLNNPQAIELLVLSACETAAGDDKATLGLAGMAVRSGARSTLASLWTVNDEATAKLMSKFYEQLSTNNISKAESLRQAKLSLLNTFWYKHPFYWASYILVGNWL